MARELVDIIYDETFSLTKGAPTDPTGIGDVSAGYLSLKGTELQRLSIIQIETNPADAREPVIKEGRKVRQI